jgi:hypothetical protein
MNYFSILLSCKTVFVLYSVKDNPTNLELGSSRYLVPYGVKVFLLKKKYKKIKISLYYKEWIIVPLVSVVCHNYFSLSMV